MKRLAIIFTFLGWLFSVLIIIGWLWPNARYKAWSIFRKEVSVIYEGESGNIYQIGVRHDATDSLIEFYWNRSFVGKGYLAAYGRNTAELKEYVFNYFNAKAAISYLVTAGSDSNYCYFIKPDSSDNSSAEVFNFNTLNEIHFYGKKLPIDETIKTGMILLYGHPVDYQFIKVTSFDP